MKDIDVNAQNENGHSVLHDTAYNGNTVILKLLLKRKDIEINPKDNYEKTPLCLAIEEKDIKIGDIISFTPKDSNKVLIHRVIDINQDEEGTYW